MKTAEIGTDIEAQYRSDSLGAKGVCEGKCPVRKKAKTR